MSSRATSHRIRATSVVALLALLAVLPALPQASAAQGETCGDPIPLSANGNHLRQGGSGQQELHFLHHATGPVTYVAAPLYTWQNIYLQIYTEGCGTSLCFSDVGGSGATESCSVAAGEYFSVRIYSLGHGIESNLAYSGTPIPECRDRYDNDGDGWTNYPADPGCASSSDPTESPNPQCSDGADNDADGWTDYPDDPGCASLRDDAENPNPACSDGEDNDGDGLEDYPADPGCSSLRDTTEGVDCPETAPLTQVCMGVGPPTRVLTLERESNGVAHRVAGYLDTYRFPLPNGASARVNCVTLLVDDVEHKSCEPKGIFLSRDQTLFDQTVFEPVPQGGPEVAAVHVCAAELTVLVANQGVENVVVPIPC